ncbi:MAG: hypothetical protein JWQ90_1956 [Hydrocarboniphaga sp.]|nr:DUF167 domain-containing protein [Hydrocarboniphaga sp.]MDB5969506.1 hypothetical protein [Hydrocarboniphaga sp.]
MKATPVTTARLALKVSPKASRDALTGWRGDTLKISVTAAPERGKASQAVIELLAESLGLPRGSIRVLRGETSQDKIVEITGMDDAMLRIALARRLG